MSRSTLLADFIGSANARILILGHRPADFDGRCVLVCPPFAEEMNKSRRMVTELAHRLCAIGYAVVVPDLFGTGDSDGDFSDATWGRWLADLQVAESWANTKGWQVTAILGVRLGCLLGAQYAALRAESVATPLSIFWQPVTDGARAIEQFFRMRLAASMMRDNKETMAGLRAQLAAGKVVDISGYGVSENLVREVESLKMAALVAPKSEIRWFEVLRSPDAQIPMPVTRTVEQLTQRGVHVSLRTLAGEPFWTSTEIVLVPELLNLTVDALRGEQGQVVNG